MDDTVYCIVRILASPIDTTKQTQNDQYLLGPEQGPDRKRAGKHRHILRDSTPELSTPTLAMRINKGSMKRPHQGHQFGSDSHDCDVLLDTSNRRGVSGVHFRLALTGIAPDGTGSIVLSLVNTSAQNTVEVDGVQLLRADQHPLTKHTTHHVVAGPVSLSIDLPDHQLDLAALEDLHAARLQSVMILGARKISRLRTSTPIYQGWVTLQDIPWQGGDKYALSEHCAGSGEFSTVRTARRASDQQTVAVKIIGDGNVAAYRRSPRHLQERELDTMHGLNHTNVIRLLDYAFYDNEPYATLLVLEWATWGSLRKRFPADAATDAANGQPEPLSKIVAGRILAGLEYLHDRNIIHRDVNPDNILVMDGNVSSFHCKIADFTYAQQVQLGSLPTDAKGTLAYMSLECAEGRACDHRTDVFSCGKVTYWLRTGSDALPTTRMTRTPYECMINHLKTWQPMAALRPLGLPLPCQDLLRSMLSNTASDRPSARECLQSTWFTASGLAESNQDTVVSEAGTNPNADTDAGSLPDTEVNTDAASLSDTEVNTDVASLPDTEANTEADTEVDTGGRYWRRGRLIRGTFSQGPNSRYYLYDRHS
ncbi:Protein kinase protein rad53 [Friedmanniomyces endolithicus]|nr:Protein kinase protein rad53 [Friedmanniomyces endolithicus]